MNDNQFIVVGFSMLDCDKYRKIMTSSKGIEITYQWLRRRIIRAPMIDPCSREVFDKYYMNNLLGVSITEEKLAEKLYLSRPTVHKNLKILDKEGLIDIKELETKKGGSKQVPQRVYILGRWVSEIDLNGEEKVREYLYAFNLLKSDIFTIKQVVDEHTV